MALFGLPRCPLDVCLQGEIGSCVAPPNIHTSGLRLAAPGAKRSFGDRCLNWVNFGALRETGPCDRTACCVPDPMSVMRKATRKTYAQHCARFRFDQEQPRHMKEMDAVQSHVLGVVCSDSNGDERKYQS